MQFSVKGGDKAIKKAVLRKTEGLESDIIKIFQYAGEKAIKEARNALYISPSLFPKGDYQDQTGNLRSSIGYVITRNGEIVSQKVQGNLKGVNAFFQTVQDFLKRSNN